MIGNDDIQKYIDEAAKLEQQMMDNYSFLLDHLDDASLRRRLENLLRQEEEHAGTCVKEVRSLVENNS